MGLKLFLAEVRLRFLQLLIDVAVVLAVGVRLSYVRLPSFILRKNIGKKKESNLHGSKPPPPETVAVVLAEPEINKESIKKIAYILKCCCSTKAKNVLLYEATGFLKDYPRQLSELLDNDVFNVTVGWGSPLPGPFCAACHPLVGATHGSGGGGLDGGGYRVSLRILAAEDAYHPVLRAIAHGDPGCSRCGASIREKDKDHRAATRLLEAQMAAAGGGGVLLKPDLVLVVGPVFTLYGFPPPQAAAAELIHVGPLSRLDERGVARAFSRFREVNQRFGQ